MTWYLEKSRYGRDTSVAGVECIQRAGLDVEPESNKGLRRVWALVGFFYKGLDSIYFTFCRPCGFT